MNTYSEKNFPFKVVLNGALCEVTTFRLGGSCRGLITCQDVDELAGVISFLRSRQLPFIVIGTGSNLLVSDSGVDCFVVRFVSPYPLIERDGECVQVVAGSILDDVVAATVENGLDGITFASGIPGTIGGAVVGNAGAFGRQIAEVVKRVTVLHPDGTVEDLPRAALSFGYRDSIFKNNDDIVLSVELALSPGDPTALRAGRERILAERKEKHPDWREVPSAGSFFKNIESEIKSEKRQSAGLFLEQAGAKSLWVGGAKVYEKHANIIVATDGCTAQDVFDLSCKLQECVHKKFDLTLVREVRCVGTFNAMPPGTSSLVW